MSATEPADGAQRESVEEVWARMRRHLDRARSFWLGFVFTGHPRVAATLAERARWNRRLHAAEFDHIVVESPQRLATIADEILARRAHAGDCVWIEAVRLGHAPDTDRTWQQAWVSALQELNHRRDTLRRGTFGLVLVLPPPLKSEAMRVASDLWSVRDFLAEPAAASVVGDVQPEHRLTDWSSGSALRPRPVSLAGERSEAQHTELLELLAATDAQLRGEFRERLAAVIDAAVARSDRSAASPLLLRRAQAREAIDPAGARDDYREAADQAPDDVTATNALRGLLSLELAAEDWTSAAANADRILTMVERLAAATPTRQSQRDVARALNDAGRVRWESKDLAAAETYLVRALHLRQDLADTEGTPDALRELAVSLNHVGWVEMERGNLEVAKRLFRRSLALSEDLVRRQSSPMAVRDVSVALNNLGHACQGQGDLAGAEEFFGRGLALREQLLGQMETALAVRDVSRSLGYLGRVRWDQGDVQRAEELFQRSVDLARQLELTAAAPQSLRDLSNSLIDLGRIRRAQGDTRGAEALFRRALSVDERLAKRAGTPQSLRYLARTLERLATLRRLHGDPEGSVRRYRRLLDVLNQIGASPGYAAEVARLRDGAEAALAELAGPVPDPAPGDQEGTQAGPQG